MVKGEGAESRIFEDVLIVIPPYKFMAVYRPKDYQRREDQEEQHNAGEPWDRIAGRVSTTGGRALTCPVRYVSHCASLYSSYSLTWPQRSEHLMYIPRVLVLRTTTSSAVAQSGEYTMEAIYYQATMSLQNAYEIS